MVNEDCFVFTHLSIYTEVICYLFLTKRSITAIVKIAQLNARLDRSNVLNFVTQEVSDIMFLFPPPACTQLLSDCINSIPAAKGLEFDFDLVHPQTKLYPPKVVDVDRSQLIVVPCLERKIPYHGKIHWFIIGLFILGYDFHPKYNICHVITFECVNSMKTERFVHLCLSCYV